MKRRELLKSTILGGGLTVFGLGALPSCTTTKKDHDQNRNPADDATSVKKSYRVRYEANSAEAVPHIQTYQKVIAIMQQNPEFFEGNKKIGNGLNWLRQAQIHLDHCPHGTWAFFPWHREYLFRLEEIIRAVSGDEEFCLPYWDWSRNPNLPAFCRQQPAYLNEDSRKTDISNLVEAQANLNIVLKTLATKDFIAFMGSAKGSGEIEYGPHNGIHVAVGGTMGTFKSPIDPVFWMHHCNIDRLWAIWQEDNPTWFSLQEIQDKFPEWLPLALEGFYERDGQPVTTPRLVREVLDTFAIPFRYCYPETEPNSAGLRTKPRMPASVERAKLKVRAFNRDNIRFELKKLKQQPNTYQLQLPDFKGKVGDFLDDYLIHPEKYEKFYFRLRTQGFPRLAKGTSLRICLMVQGANDIFITNYNFFDSTKEESTIAGLTAVPGPNHSSRHDHHATLTVPRFYFDYEKVLKELRNKSISKYPEPTNFKIEFITTATKTSMNFDPAVFKELNFKLIVLERVGISVASDASDVESQD